MRIIVAGTAEGSSVLVQERGRGVLRGEAFVAVVEATELEIATMSPSGGGTICREMGASLLSER